MFNANALKAEIVRNGMTQGEVAKRIGMTPVTFSKKMSTGKFGIEEAQDLIDLLNIGDVNAIFFSQQ